MTAEYHDFGILPTLGARRTTVLITAILLTIPCQSQARPWARHTIDASSRGADGVRLADVNGDGRPDIATGWEEGGKIRVYLNPGPAKVRSLWPQVTVGSVRSPEDAVFADLDGDGAVDVVSCCEGKTRTVYVHWAPRERDRYLEETAWRTEAIPATLGKQLFMFAVPMDIDGAGGIDLVVGSKGTGAAIGWLENPSSPRDLARWKYHRLADAGWIMSLQAHDVDADGHLDIVASDRKGPNRSVLWLRNPGPAGARRGGVWTRHRVTSQPREFMFLAAGMAPGADRPYLVCGVKDRTILRLRPPAARPITESWEASVLEFPNDCGTAKGIAVGDLDLDGRVDLVFSCEQADGDKSGVRWLSPPRAPEDRVWMDHDISGPAGIKFDHLELLDLDRDGDLDVLTCEERANLGVIWYENPSR